MGVVGSVAVVVCLAGCGSNDAAVADGEDFVALEWVICPSRVNWTCFRLLWVSAIPDCRSFPDWVPSALPVADSDIGEVVVGFLVGGGV